MRWGSWKEQWHMAMRALTELLLMPLEILFYFPPAMLIVPTILILTCCYIYATTGNIIAALLMPWMGYFIFWALTLLMMLLRILIRGREL